MDHRPALSNKYKYKSDPYYICVLFVLYLYAADEVHNNKFTDRIYNTAR